MRLESQTHSPEGTEMAPTEQRSEWGSPGHQENKVSSGTCRGSSAPTLHTPPSPSSPGRTSSINIAWELRASAPLPRGL